MDIKTQTITASGAPGHRVHHNSSEPLLSGRFSTQNTSQLTISSWTEEKMLLMSLVIIKICIPLKSRCKSIVTEAKLDRGQHENTNQTILQAHYEYKLINVPCKLVWTTSQTQIWVTKFMFGDVNLETKLKMKRQSHLIHAFDICFFIYLLFYPKRISSQS